MTTSAHTIDTALQIELQRAFVTAAAQADITKIQDLIEREKSLRLQGPLRNNDPYFLSSPVYMYAITQAQDHGHYAVARLLLEHSRSQFFLSHSESLDGTCDRLKSHLNGFATEAIEFLRLPQTGHNQDILESLKITVNFLMTQCGKQPYIMAMHQIVCHPEPHRAAQKYAYLKEWHHRLNDLKRDRAHKGILSPVFAEKVTGFMQFKKTQEKKIARKKALLDGLNKS